MTYRSQETIITPSPSLQKGAPTLPAISVPIPKIPDYEYGRSQLPLDQTAVNGSWSGPTPTQSSPVGAAYVPTDPLPVWSFSIAWLGFAPMSFSVNWAGLSGLATWERTVSNCSKTQNSITLFTSGDGIITGMRYNATTGTMTPFYANSDYVVSLQANGGFVGVQLVSWDADWITVNTTRTGIDLSERISFVFYP